nr:hypothetical protein B0A51_09035 [Rachicladosporium sp. CCFEE 5018]
MPSLIFMTSAILGALALGASAIPAPEIVERSFSFNIPASKGSVTYKSAQKVSGTFDGGMKTYGRGVSCTGQAEGGDADAVFLVQNGGTLKNVIIGKDQIEGVHCLGSCTIENVWWTDVCEDALSFKGAGTAVVKGGGARGAADKIIQNNAASSVTIDGFSASDFGKLYRSCGNCKGNGARRAVTIKNVKASGGKVLIGINSNYGDTATISNTCATGVKSICDEYQGNNNAAEPKKLSSGPSNACKYSKNYQYSLRTRESDDTLRGDQRNATLIRAAAEGQTPRVQYLIRRGVDVDHTDQHGLTALHHAVYCGFDDTVALLIDEGADVSARSFQCGTPLHLAVLNGRMSTLKVLRDNRADASAKCRLFGTALHLACHAGDLELCHVLLERNREAQLAQLAEVSLATGALRCNLNELNELEVQVTIACSPLHIVAKLGHLSLAKMLLASGANINAVDEAGYSATMYALRDRHFDVMQELLSQGAVPTRMRILESQIIPGDDGGLETTMRPPGSAPDRPYARTLSNRTTV